MSCAGVDTPEAADDPDTPAKELKRYYDRVFDAFQGDLLMELQDIIHEVDSQRAAGTGAHRLDDPGMLWEALACGQQAEALPGRVFTMMILCLALPIAASYQQPTAAPLSHTDV